MLQHFVVMVVMQLIRVLIPAFSSSCPGHIMSLHQVSAPCGVHGSEFEKNSWQFSVTMVKQQLRLVGYRVTHHYTPIQNIVGLWVYNLEVGLPACLIP